MQTYTSFMPDLAYDPNETFEQFCARRQHALEQGRQAIRERRLKPALLVLYEAIVERVGANRYTWVSEETWAEEFHVDPSTIKRWIGKLVQAHLIRRQRQFGTSSRTYITAYDRETVTLDGKSEPVADALPTEQPPESETDDQAKPIQEPRMSVIRKVFFRGRSAPTFGAKMRRDHINVSHLNTGGGDVETAKNQGVAPEIRQLLEREGVMTFYVAPLLQQRPTEELQAVSRYLDQQSNVRDRARLFASLVMSGFGALLLAGRVKQRPRAAQRSGPTTPIAATSDHLRYVSGALAAYIQGGNLEDTGVTSSGSFAEQRLSAPAEPPGSILAHMWQQARDHLRQELPASEFHTWFETATLVDFTNERAIVGVPNIFAREMLTERYQTQMAEALRTSCGNAVDVQVVIAR